ncbi:MAG: MFS transporter [Dehalococcoidia bacterium]|nr:MFS transporter [Dehalococcoidia bacterium]
MSHPATSLAPGSGRFDLRMLLFSVYVPAFLMSVGQGAVLPIIPLYAKELGAAAGLAAAVVALRGVGTMTFDLPAGLAVARWGDKRTMVVGAFALSAVSLVAGLSSSVLQLAVAIFLLGGGMGIWVLTRLVYVSEVTPVAHRGRALAMLGGTNRVGTFIGPVIGGVLGQFVGLQSAFFLQGALAALAAVLMIFLVRDIPKHTADGEGEANLYRRLGATVVDNRRPFLTAGPAMIALQILRTGRQVLIPLWGDAIGLDVAVIGLIFGISSAIDMTMFYPVGLLMDRVGRKFAAVPSLLILSLSMALIPLTDSALTLTLVGLLSGIGNGLSTGLVMTLGADYSPPGNRGEFLGVWRLVGDIGTAAGPLVIGGITGVLTLGISAVATAGLGLAGAAVMAFLAAETLTKEAPDREEETGRSGAPP